MNQNQSSRPFLRLFSGLQSSEAANDGQEKTANIDPKNGPVHGHQGGCCETADPAAGLAPNTSCDQQPVTKRQSKPLQPEDKMIAGSVGPRSDDPVSPGPSSPGPRSPGPRPSGPRSVDCSTDKPRRVEVSLADIAPVLADAINHQRGWLSDFSDDTVTIDADLYEVLLAYQQMRRLNAA